MPTAVVGNHPIAFGRQEQHLRFPAIRIQRPTVAENDGLTRTPVFVVNFGAVAGGESAHELFILVPGRPMPSAWLEVSECQA